MSKVPRRTLHFSDGTLEEYSSDEEDEMDNVKRQTTQLSSQNTATLRWIPWIWHQTYYTGSKTLEMCDYVGESLASFFGITTPKYQAEIDHYFSFKNEEEQKKKEEIEFRGWSGGRQNSVEFSPVVTNQRNLRSTQWTHQPTTGIQV